MAYATIEQLESSWRAFEDYERPHVVQALDDASVFIDGQMAACGRSAADVGDELLRTVCCALVRRAFGELDPTNADDRWSQLVEPGALNVTPAVKRSDFYLTQWERRALGVRVGRAAFAGCGE